MKKLILLFSIVAFAFISCKKSGISEISRDRLQSLILGKDTLQLYVGESKQLPLTINPSNYHTDSIKWKSSDSTIISISNAGLLSAKKIGSSIITVSNLTNTTSVNCLVTVVAAPAGIDSLKVGLILYFPFNNEGADSSGNGNNGYVHNITSVPDRFGNPNSAYYFNGDTSSYILVKDNSQIRLANTDYTINLWVDINFNPNYGGIILTKRFYNDQGGIDFSVAKPNSIYPIGNPSPTGTIYYGPGGTFPGIYSTGVVSTNSWTMITLVYNYANHQLKLYRNGVLDNTSSQNIASVNSLADLYFGRDNPATGSGPDYNLRGSMDDIRIYNRGLSVSEINKLYNLPNNKL